MTRWTDGKLGGRTFFLLRDGEGKTTGFEDAETGKVLATREEFLEFAADPSPKETSIPKPPKEEADKEGSE